MPLWILLLCSSAIDDHHWFGLRTLCISWVSLLYLSVYLSIGLTEAYGKGGLILESFFTLNKMQVKCPIKRCQITTLSTTHLKKRCSGPWFGTFFLEIWAKGEIFLRLSYLYRLFGQWTSLAFSTNNKANLSMWLVTYLAKLHIDIVEF